MSETNAIQAAKAAAKPMEKATAKPMEKATPTPPVDHHAAIKAAFLQAIDEQIGGDKDHGWGLEDSVTVIKAVFTADGKGCKGDYIPSEIAMTYASYAVNPSQMRQRLEAAKKLNEAPKGSRRTTNIFA